MRDREAINRFCAFSLLGEESYRGDMDAFLARTLEKMQASSTDLDSLRVRFDASMRVNQELFGEHAFRKSLVSGAKRRKISRSVLNISLFDVCSVLFAEHDVELIEKNINAIREALCELVNTEEFSNAITYSANSSQQIRTRFLLARVALSKVLT